MPPDQIPQGANFFVWALVIVCGVLATLAGGVIRWSVTHLEKKEIECKSERAEDQKQFLLALASRDAQMSLLCESVKQVTKIVEEHHGIMLAKHGVEAETIARLAGEAAVRKFRHDNPVN